jgi:hypothetical protein
MKKVLIAVLIILMATPFFVFAVVENGVVKVPAVQKDANGVRTYVTAIKTDSAGIPQLDAQGNYIYITETTANPTAPISRLTEFQQSATGEISPITLERDNSNGIIISESFATEDASGNLLSKKVSTNGSTLGSLTTVTTAYDSNKNPTSVSTDIYANNLLASNSTIVYAPDGNMVSLTKNEYDNSGKEIPSEKQVTTYKYTDNAVVGTTVDSSGTVIGLETIPNSGLNTAITDTQRLQQQGGNNTPNINGNYVPLSPIVGPGGEKMDFVSTTNFPSFLNMIYRIGIGACFALGVIMFTWAGIEYIVSESMSGKGDGKERMKAALTGLAIALASYIILQTINPDLLEFKNIDVTTSATNQ